MDRMYGQDLGFSGMSMWGRSCYVQGISALCPVRGLTDHAIQLGLQKFYHLIV